MQNHVGESRKIAFVKFVEAGEILQAHLRAGETYKSHPQSQPLLRAARCLRRLAL